MSTVLENSNTGTVLQNSAAIQGVSDWLVEQGLRGTSLNALFSGFCERLTGTLGLPLWRGNISMRTLHPNFASILFTWRRGEGVEDIQIEHADGEPLDWLQSPYFFMLENEHATLRRDMRDPAAQLEFPILKTLHAQGGVDYLAQNVLFGDAGIADDRTGVMASWATDRETGFAAVEVAILERLLPRLALTVKSILTLEITKTIAATYIGLEAGGRVLNGEIRRGHVEVIPAVILFADIRGFTNLADRMPRDDLVPMLDDYLECMVAPIVEHGGQVLKFLGDGLLAVFDLRGSAEDSICHDAMTAAVRILEMNKTANVRRQSIGLAPAYIDVALHLGDVLYGNVGASGRLDFTVIGPAVNEASRIEALSAELGLYFLVSEAFAKAATQCSEHLVSAGRHVLRGIDREQELFTLKYDELARAV